MHVLEPGGGGTMRHVIDLATEQARRGHQVHIVYSPVRMEKLFAPQLEQLQGITLHSLPMRRAPHITDISNLWQLVQLVQNVQPNILHGHSTKAGMMVRLARLFTKTKVIYTPHAFMTMNPDMAVWKKFFYASYEQVLSPLMHRLIVLSNQEWQHAQSLGISIRKLAMGLSGVAPMPPAKPNLRQELGLNKDHIIVGFVGRFAHQKYPELAVESFAIAAQEDSRLRLLMIGSGELETLCKELAAQLDVADKILWLGSVNARDYYGIMDMLLITSRYENMAYTLIEALHAGLPIITPTVGISDNCVQEDQNGFIVPLDATVIGKTILSLANDASLRDAMHTASRIHARHFTLAEMHKHHYAIYHDG